MAIYSLLSGTRYTVKASSEEQAEEKLVAYWNGLDCPCGLPQCTCVEEGEVDTDITVEHVGAPEPEDERTYCEKCFVNKNENEFDTRHENPICFECSEIDE